MVAGCGQTSDTLGVVTALIAAALGAAGLYLATNLWRGRLTKHQVEALRYLNIRGVARAFPSFAVGIAICSLFFTASAINADAFEPNGGNPITTVLALATAAAFLLGWSAWLLVRPKWVIAPSLRSEGAALSVWPLLRWINDRISNRARGRSRR